MKTLKVDPLEPKRGVISKAAKVLLDGGVIVYPTDTVYGLGCILERECVERVYKLKGRDYCSPLSVAFKDMDMVMHYSFLDRKQEERVRIESVKGMTFIVRKKNIPDYVTAGLETVGVRIPANRICYELTDRVGPLVSTSANKTGANPAASIGDLDIEIIDGVDLVLDAGKCEIGNPSTIVDLTLDGKVVRR